MKLRELISVICGCGFKTGFDTESDNLLIMSKGYQKLGEINQDEQFSVHLNKHFRRQVSRKDEIEIYKAIFKFVETPVGER